MNTTSNKQQKNAAIILVTGWLIALILIGPFGVVKNIISSQVVSTAIGQNIYCYSSTRGSPKNGCYNVDRKITWSNYKTVGVINTQNRNKHATNVSTTIEIIIFVSLLIVTYLVANHTKRKS